MSNGMSETDLLALIGQYEKSSLGASVAAGATVGGKVSPSNQSMNTLEVDRYNAINAYYARPLGNEVQDRSQVVIPEFRDTIEWVMPQLMRMFAATLCLDSTSRISFWPGIRSGAQRLPVFIPFMFFSFPP